MSKRQFKPVSLKPGKSTSDEPEIWTSPKFPRKNDPQSSIKITQNEVEEKLKFMRLKRLSRLGTSVNEQSSHQEGDEVLSFRLKDGDDRVKPTFKRIAEEILEGQASQEMKTELEKTPEMITTEINKDMNRSKTSTTKKFINKFNCAMNTDEVSSRDNIEMSPDAYSKPIGAPHKTTSAVETGNSEGTKHTMTSNKITSQRKTIYFKDNEPVPPDLILSTSSPITRFQMKSTTKKDDIQGKSNDAGEKDAQKDQSSILGLNKTEIQVSSIGENDVITRQLSEGSSNTQGNSSDHPEPATSPLLPVRSGTREVKILKKFQHTCESLDEILKYDSDIDLDEIDDMRTNLDEAASLLTEYQNKLKALAEKVSSIVCARQRLCAVKSDLRTVKNEIETFNGLKRDLQYMRLCNRLSNFYLELNNIFKKFELGNEEKELLTEVEKCIRDLEVKVARNEDILYEILSDQVERIGSKYLSVNI